MFIYIIDYSIYCLFNLYYSIVRKEDVYMDQKRELRQQYKETKTQASIYQVRNSKNQKVLVASTPNIKILTRIKLDLEQGIYRNNFVQKEINEYGKDAFVIEVLEVLEVKDDGYFDVRFELKKLEKKWLNKLQPYGDKGYNIIKDDNH